MTIAGLTAILLAYRYWILFPIAVIEGPFLALVVGSLSALGYFDPYLAYLVLIFGDFIPDTALYFTGRWGKRAKLLEKYGHKIGMTPERFAHIERLWHEHPKKTMVMSKQAIGLSGPFLVSAGLSGLSLRTYYAVAIPLTLVQYAVYLFLGYHFTNSLAIVEGYIGKWQLFVGIIALCAILYYTGASLMRKRVLSQVE